MSATVDQKNAAMQGIADALFAAEKAHPKSPTLKALHQTLSDAADLFVAQPENAGTVKPNDGTPK